MSEKEGLVKWFSELSSKDVAIAGGKGASLAEMYNNKFPIPPGFMITANAYTHFVTKAGLQEKIDAILHNIDIQDTAKLQKASKDIRALIEGSAMPKDLEEQILEAYDVLDVNKDMIGAAKATALSILKNSHEPPFVAVRSSATTEDLAEASFAGQQDSFLNVKGHRQLIEKVKQCLSSLFTARAIYYRLKKGFTASSSQLAVVVQKMVNSDKSGVMFSKNPVDQSENVMIEAVWGLGEGIVSGMIKPDNYIIGREKFNVISTDVSEKKVAIVRTSAGDNETVKLSADRSKQQVLSTHELMRLAQYALKLEEHYKKPQDIEFAISGGELYIVQSRPITTKAVDKSKVKEIKGEELLKGLGASPGVASGVVKIIHSLAELSKVKKGDVMVTEMTNPDMVVSMEKASAIITDEGGITSHAAIVSREMGIPAVVGTGTATKDLHDGDIVTVDGFNGRVYSGKGESKTVEILPVVPTRTKLRVLVDIPSFAPRAALTGIQSVGLVRLEGVIAASGKHPLAFVKAGKEDDYAKLIADGLDTIAQHFSEMWVRSSDLRSDEYLNLEGAPQDHEGNPMLGNHGIRFSLQNVKILEAELQAVKYIAEKHPDKKLGFMIPQVIRVDEVTATQRLAEKLKMPSNVIFGIMVETPAAVQVINELCATGIKFISFGTNDLTQYMLAIDRNNAGVQPLYDEMNPAVLSALSYVIRRCKKFGVQTSICGQAGSKPEMVKFLLSEGIDSISVNADAAKTVSEIVRDAENMQSGNSVQRAAAQEVREIVEKKKEVKEDARSYKDQDIEQMILKELEPSEYQPGGINEKDPDMPKLNDAITVDPNEVRAEELRTDFV
jgi:pyruvate, water dikinase